MNTVVNRTEIFRRSWFHGNRKRRGSDGQSVTLFRDSMSGKPAWAANSTLAMVLLYDLSSERPNKSKLDQGKRNFLSSPGPQRRSVVDCGASKLESGRTAHHCYLVFLQILLLRFLCHRTLRGSRLSVFRPDFLCTVFDFEKTPGLRLQDPNSKLQRSTKPHYPNPTRQRLLVIQPWNIDACTAPK